MKTITYETVTGLWQYMTWYYASSVIDKDNSESMQMIASALDMMGIMDKDTFMKKYTTTVGSTIYIPFEIGVSDSRYSLMSQIRTCVHEHEHVIQWQQNGVRFMLNYLSSSAQRAAYEVEAMRCSMEMQWWYNRTIPDIDRMSNKLKGYNCKAEDIETTRRALSMISKTIMKDGIVSNAGKIAIEYLDTRV